MHSINFRKGRASRILTVAALATATAVGLAACSAAEPDEESTEPQILTIAVPAPPVSLDPALQNVDPTNNWFIQLSYDPLIRLDNTGTPVPDLAESWSYLDDESTEFELKLREGVEFSDGTPVDADAVVGSLEYLIASGVNGATWLGADTTVTATDDMTVLIETATPNSVLPFLLTQRTHLGSVINPSALADPESLKSGSFGAGPYVLDSDETISDDTYVYVPNENYWDESKIHWDKIVLKVSGSAAASLQAVQNGEADLMRGDVTTATAAEASGLTVDTVPAGLYGVGYLDRAGEIAPELANAKVRQALSYAIDRESITEAIWGKYGKPGNTLTLEGFAGFTEEASEAYEYDPEKAKELLAEAGYPNGFSFNMQSTNAGGGDIPAQAIVENWAAIGVTANLTIYSDTAQLVADTLAKKYAVGIYFYGAQQQYVQAKSFFTGGSSQYNPFLSQDEEIMEALEAAAAAPTLEEQDELYAKALDRAVVDLAWFSGVAYTPSVMIAAPSGLTGLSFSSLTASPDVAWEVAPSGE